VDEVTEVAEGTDGIDALGGPASGDSGPATWGAVVDALTHLQPDDGRRGAGVGPVTRLLIEVAEAVAADLPVSQRFADAEFVATLTVELARRYLRAVRGHARGTPVTRAWEVVLDRCDAPVRSPAPVALAGVNALLDHDLTLALVSTFTLLGRSPGAAERRDVEALTALIGDRLHDAAYPGCAGHADASDDECGLAFLLPHSESWWRAEHLWTLRGRPAAAEAERASIDRRASLVGRGLLAEAA